MRLLRVAVPSVLLVSLAACTGLPQGPAATPTSSSSGGLIQKLPDELISNNANSLTMTLSNGAAAYSTMAAPAAPQIQHVYVTFDQVQVHYDATASVATPPATESADADAGWISLPASASQPIDLIGLSADTLFGASSSLKVGTYTQIRLPVTSAQVVADGQPAPLDIASGNLKIIKPFEIKAGTQTTLHFDFDTAHSLTSANGQWKLRPTAIKTVATYEALPAATSSAEATASTGS